MTGEVPESTPNHAPWSRQGPAVGPGAVTVEVVDAERAQGKSSPYRRLPHGVHGPSRTVDHAAFAWTDEGWSSPALADAIIYELHVRGFSMHNPAVPEPLRVLKGKIGRNATLAALLGAVADPASCSSWAACS